MEGQVPESERPEPGSRPQGAGEIRIPAALAETRLECSRAECEKNLGLGQALTQTRFGKMYARKTRPLNAGRSHRRALRRHYDRQGRVQQSNFHDYPMLRINEMPAVEVYIAPSKEAAGGIVSTLLFHDSPDLLKRPRCRPVQKVALPSGGATSNPFTTNPTRL